MSAEDELLALARAREAAAEDALQGAVPGPPHMLRRQMRAYLQRQVDRKRISRLDEKAVQLVTASGGRNEVTCPSLEFASGVRLEFNMRFQEERSGWAVRSFEFHLFLPKPRRIRMVRIHLNEGNSHDPLRVARCHLHIDGSETHVPFPVMNPRLILHHICEHLEPDFGAAADEP